jgi:hypothetical protein
MTDATANDTDIVVYREWPVEVIEQAREEFRDIMNDGAGVEELSAGLHGLDFLCRRSLMPDDLRDLVDATIEQAEMRIALLHHQEAATRSDDENRKRALKVLQDMRIYSLNITKRLAPIGADALRKRYPYLMQEPQSPFED